MDGLIENVARALSIADGNHPDACSNDGDEIPAWTLYVDDAKAAMVAARDCSQGMRIAGHAALTESKACAPDLGDKIGFAALGDAWRAMIDDALSRT